MAWVETIFGFSAFIGVALLVVWLIMLFIGGAGGGDVDEDVAHDGEGRAAAHSRFRLLSFQGLPPFFMAFGLAGLALLRHTRVALTWVGLGAAAAGVAALMVAAKVFSLVRSTTVKA